MGTAFAHTKELTGTLVVLPRKCHVSLARRLSLHELDASSSPETMEGSRVCGGDSSFSARKPSTVVSFYIYDALVCISPCALQLRVENFDGHRLQVLKSFERRW